MKNPSVLRAIRAQRWAAGLAFASALTATSLAADVQLYGIGKEAASVQTNGSTPVLQATNPFAFAALVVATTNDTVTSAYVQSLPGGTATNLTQDTNTGSFSLQDRFPDEATLDAAYPNAGYALGIQTAIDGFRQPQLSLSAAIYPQVPRISNFTNAQQIVTGDAFTLQWDAFSGGATNDPLQLVITDGQSNVVFATPASGQSNALDGTSTSVLIPTNTFQPGRSYRGSLLYAKLYPNPSNQLFLYPGVPGAAAFASRTTFPLMTISGGATVAPTLRVTAASSSAITVQFDAEAGIGYRLFGTTNVAGTNWTEVFSTNAASTNVMRTETIGAGDGVRFYRVVSP